MIRTNFSKTPVKSMVSLGELFNSVLVLINFDLEQGQDTQKNRFSPPKIHNKSESHQNVAKTARSATRTSNTNIKNIILTKFNFPGNVGQTLRVSEDPLTHQPDLEP